MKNKILLLVTLIVMSFSQSAFATGIPVFDASNLAQAILQIAKMVEEINILQQQLTKAEEELANISGIRGLGDVIDTEYDISTAVDPQKILKDMGIKSASDLGLEDETADLFKDKSENTARWIAESEKSLEQARSRFSELTKLIDKVDDSPDQKDILDLQARINAEEVMLNNEMAKITLLKSRAEAHEQMYNQKISQMVIESAGESHHIEW